MIIFRIFITATLVYSFFTNFRDNFITKSLVTYVLTDESVKFWKNGTSMKTPLSKYTKYAGLEFGHPLVL